MVEKKLNKNYLIYMNEKMMRDCESRITSNKQWLKKEISDIEESNKKVKEFEKNIESDNKFLYLLKNTDIFAEYKKMNLNKKSGGIV